MNIIFNNNIIKFDDNDFPILINGKNKSGASLFSITLLANLFLQGEKVLLFSAYPEAKEEFRNQVGDKINKNAEIINDGDENSLIDYLKNNDTLDKIILFKNIENYSIDTFNKLKNNEKVIFSGNIDECEFAEELIKKDFETKILFSYSEIIDVDNKIDLPKYNAHIISPRFNGIISLE